MKTVEEIQAAIIAAHDPSLKDVECAHVSQIWEDGEVTSTKCGSLFGFRNSHQMRGPIFGVNMDLPVATNNGHKYAFVPHDLAFSFHEQLHAASLVRASGPA